MYNPYQQQFGFNPQQTGYSGGFNNQQQQFQQFQQPYQQPLQSQPTNFYQPGVPQQTGYGMAPQLQNQQTGYTVPQQPQVQQTGYFQNQATVPSPGSYSASGIENNTLKIPDIRLSFITLEDQKKYEHLFRTAVPQGEQAISGDSASEILLRSGLPPVTLAEIWSLSDTNKSGSLLFPEFALSLHLSSMAKRNESIPANLPEKWQNEVKSFVDAINFSIPEDPTKILANTPFSKFGQTDSSNGQQFQPQSTGFNNFSNTGPSNEFMAPQITGFQPQSSFGQALNAQRTGGNPLQSQPSANPLVSQRTGGGTLVPLQPQQTAGLIPVQKTGPNQLEPQRTGMAYQPTGSFNQNANGIKPQLTGFQPQRTGLQSQQTGQQLQPQLTGFQPQQSGFQPQQTGFQQQQTGFQQQQTGFQPQQTGFQAPLTQQPTGRPGEWGFISAPTGGIPGLNMMQLHFLPESTQSSNNLQNAMGGSQKSNVTWAITKEEKQIYDGIFSAWDKGGNGFMSGETALNIFGKSGLSRSDLESIWNLADQNDRGKLNKDEFVVAMHLVYRRLNGLELPLRLPAELIPPSTKYIQESMNSLKNSLKGGKAINNNKPAVNKDLKSDGSRYKNDDTNTSSSYISNSRHRRRSGSSNGNNSSVQSTKDTNLTVDELKKLIREKKILLEANDIEDQDRSLSNKRLQSKNLEEIELLKSKIKSVQDGLNKSSSDNISDNEKHRLLQKLNSIARDTVPSLISQINSVNKELVESKIKLIKLKLNKENPNWSDESVIVGTGPNGEVTELDKRKHRSKQLLKQRMNALTGKLSNTNEDELLNIRYQQESENIRKESKDQTDMVKDIESSIKELEDGCYSFLKSSTKDEVTQDKWEYGNGVSSAVAEFIIELNKRKATNVTSSFNETQASSHNTQVAKPTKTTDIPSVASSQDNLSKPSTPTDKYRTPEERSSYIKAQAEKKMNERLAKLGITRNRRNLSSEPSKEDTSAHKGNSVDQTKSQSHEARNDPSGSTKIDESVVPTDNSSTAQPIKNSNPITPAESNTITDPSSLVESGDLPDTNKSIKSADPGPASRTSDSEDDSEDEEYAELLKKKKELEARERERKLKKQQQKELRLAKLKEEMDNLKKKELNETDSEEEIQEINKPFTPSAVANSQTSDTAGNNPPAPEEQKLEEEIKSQPVHSLSNPFAKMANDEISSSSTNKTITPTNTNPFFKANVQNNHVDPKKVAAQRASQRGLSTDDWSDEEENSSDDEPNREGAAHLANLLFGGMPLAPTKSASSTPQPESTLVSMQENSLANQSSDEFHTPLNLKEPAEEETAAVNQLETQVSSVPTDTPLAPPAPPALPSSQPAPPSEPPAAPPAPPSEPPSAPPAPPAPPSAPPAPPSAPPAPPSAPPAPPSAPPAPPSGTVPINSNNQGAAPDLGALLSQIQLGASLKKVDESKKRIADGATVGRVL